MGDVIDVEFKDHRDGDNAVIDELHNIVRSSKKLVAVFNVGEDENPDFDAVVYGLISTCTHICNYLDNLDKDSI